MTLEQHLTAQRKFLKLTQADVSRELGVLGQYVSNCERRVCTYAVKHFITLSQVLGVPLVEMIELKKKDMGDELDREIKRLRA